MTIYNGFSIYEFFWRDFLDPGERCGELHRFSSRQEALGWLNFLGARDLELTAALRRLLARWDTSIHRLTPAQVFDVAALLLSSGRLLVRRRDEVDRAGSAPAPPEETAALPFALSDRQTKAAAPSSKASDPDVSVFQPNVDQSAQAAALIAAAKSGAPFCPE